MIECKYCSTRTQNENKVKSFTRDVGRGEDYHEAIGDIDPVVYLDTRRGQLTTTFEDYVDSTVSINYCPFCGRNLGVD